MCGVAACQINGFFADMGCAEKRPWYHPVATQPHSVDGWISLVKTCSLMILAQKDVIHIFNVTTHTIIHGTGIWISACFFMKTKHFSGSGVLYHSHGWWFMRLTFLFSFGHQPNRPPPGFFVSPSAIVYLLMINVRGAQVPKFFSWFQGLAKWWKIGMCFFQVGPYGRYKWGQKSPINDLYKWIAGVITPYNNNPCKWSSFTLLAYRRNAHRK